MILICYGTRPEFIKVKPLIDGMKGRGIKFKTLFTGQHKDIIDEFTPDYSLEIPELDNRLNSVLSSGLDFKFTEDITHVLIQGDTTSVVSMGMSAFNNGIKIIHLEAGLRTYDFGNPYPEEANRQLISRISDINLCPTELNRQNLITERAKGEHYVVGNTVLDNLVDYKKDCEYTNKVLITLHRRENHEQIEEYFEILDRIADSYPKLYFILPIHPNPNVQKHRHLLNNIKVVDPMNHSDLLKTLVKCKFVITDSGGIQEECSFFNKKVIVCRNITERPESVDIHSFMCKEPKDLYEMVSDINDDYRVDEPCPYGDGNSTEKILDIIKEL
jgi:UDP-N-acetylglucosamine 2-epimerase